MRRNLSARCGWAAALFGFCALLVLARCFTGIVYEADAPVADLVLKRRPDLLLERTESPSRPGVEGLVLDRREPRLEYDTLYLWCMRFMPGLVVAIVAGFSMSIVFQCRRVTERG